MNSLSWLDPVIALILLFAAVRGFATGLIRSASGLLGIAAGLIAASRYYAFAGDFLSGMCRSRRPSPTSSASCSCLWRLLQW
jgi:uncharacterized membrane protein required for colicin V production